MELQLQLWGSGVFHLLQDGNEVLSLSCLSAVLHSLFELFGAVWRDEEGIHLLRLRVSGGVSSGFVNPREPGDLHPPGGQAVGWL